MELLTDPHAWLAFLTLSALEIVLGIDNVVFISILVSRMDAKRGKAVRQFGLLLALVMRIIMLFGLTWLISLRDPVATVLGQFLFMARSDPDRGRIVPDRKGNIRDSS